MIANSACLAAMVVLVLGVLLLGAVDFLAPYRGVILERHLWVLVGSAVLVFVNLFALCYLAARSLLLKDTGRKLAHVEKQLHTGDTIVRDLSARLAQED